MASKEATHDASTWVVVNPVACHKVRAIYLMVERLVLNVSNVRLSSLLFFLRLILLSIFTLKAIFLNIIIVEFFSIFLLIFSFLCSKLILIFTLFITLTILINICPLTKVIYLLTENSSALLFLEPLSWAVLLFKKLFFKYDTLFFKFLPFFNLFLRSLSCRRDSSVGTHIWRVNRIVIIIIVSRLVQFIWSILAGRLQTLWSIF